MGVLVYRSSYPDLPTITNVIDVDQENGNDSTASVNGTAAKTLTKAINLAKVFEGDVKVQIVSDYRLSDVEVIQKQTTNCVVVTCTNGATITSLKEAESSTTATTTIEPEVIKVNSNYIEVSASCHQLNSLAYYQFEDYTIVSKSTDNGEYIAIVTMPIPSGVTLTTSNILEVYIAWVKAKGIITNISNNVATIELHSSNYELAANAYGIFRILNISSSSTGFSFTKTGTNYTINNNYSSMQIIGNGGITVYRAFNIHFDNCNFECIKKSNNNGLIFSTCYNSSIRNCTFKYCDFDTNNICKDIYIVNNYFYNSECTLTDNEDFYIYNNLIKMGGLIISRSGGVVANNTICYGIRGITGGYGKSGIKQDIKKLTIKNNHIHHIGLLLGADRGGIYLQGHNNTLIQNNYIHDCIGRYRETSEGSTIAIYLDEGCYGVLCRYNKILNCAASTHTNFGYGNVMYNNLFAYPLKSQIRYSNNTYECGTSFIANLFIGGYITDNYKERIKNDCALYQFNVSDTDFKLPLTPYIHDNITVEVPFRNKETGDFYVGSYKNGKISMGSTNIRSVNQSTIDTSFLDGKVYFGILEDSPYIAEQQLDITLPLNGASYSYDTWFIKAVKESYNTTNDYLDTIDTQ